MSAARNGWLLAGGLLDVAAALLHVAIVIGGPDWYLFFGAGVEMAAADARGSWVPALITLGIAAILSGWAAYAFAGAGLIRRLPLMRPVLVAISAVYLIRATLFPTMAALGGGVSLFNACSSSIILVLGLTHAAGTWLAWPQLIRERAH